ncbi:type II toxin-antitoxin system RelE/ParE family toxin [Sphingomonas sp. Leaf4]|uniref:type II toxin-antitoxin system RelE/ParE family toxin n=1 Tax=Sphingomonas sp. Leaf4 TaxID=2876553 RepID=UPI001E410B74|nr:type II toxin-antitoxin system RelE/ParE family toxin [Sphingomonas sp. Leaf4]
MTDHIQVRHCRNFMLAAGTAMPYKSAMQTVIETNAYIAAAKDAGMSADEMTAVVDTIAQNPEAGDIMPGCGGARKLRVAKPGKGKSGGYRVIFYFAGEGFPAFLLTVFGKNEKANLSKADRNALAGLTKRLTDTLSG